MTQATIESLRATLQNIATTIEALMVQVGEIETEIAVLVENADPGDVTNDPTPDPNGND